MKNRQYGLIILLFLLLGGFASQAQSGYAYFYFEGDQQTPFYVKVEGKMQPRLGKNHFIISNLDAGYTHFQILFQKNAFPAQDFLLEVPKGGSRGFVLHQVNERQFALYDLQQKRYILSGNTEADDHAPANMPLSPSGTGSVASETIAAAEQEGLPAFKPKAKKSPVTQTDRSLPSNEDRSRFIAGIELNADGSGDEGRDTDREEPLAAPPATKVNKERSARLDDLPALGSGREDTGEVPSVAASELPPVPNTDCPEAMSNEAFEAFALRVLDRSDDDGRLKFIKKVKDKYCFSTEQVRILANNLKGQSARYEVVKALYFHTSDQEHYGQLEALFNTDFLKSKFREIIHPQ
jgi:hypothetical protein